MASTSSANDNPFRDPSFTGLAEPRLSADGNATTLIVGDDVSLTLGTDALLVSDAREKAATPATSVAKCCGFRHSGGNLQTILYYNILWVEQSSAEITIHYAKLTSKSSVRPAFLNYNLEKLDTVQTQPWIEGLLDKAYGASQRQKRIKVLVNPFGGQGSAKKYYSHDIEPIFAAARCKIDVEQTEYGGHAIEIAEGIDPDSWDVIACCSGDGIPYEVFNGLAKKKDAGRVLAQVAVVQLPCGSGNAMSLNLTGTNSPSMAALAIVKGMRTPLDLVSITQGDSRTLSFLTQSLGMVAESDLDTEHLRWMGGTRFIYGFLTRLAHKSTYPVEIAMHLEQESKPAIREAYRAALNNISGTFPTKPLPPPGTELPPLRFGTVNDPLPDSFTPLTSYPSLGVFYAGNMSYVSADAIFFPAALPNDGCIDLLTLDAKVPLLKSLSMITKVEKGAPFFDDDLVNYRKVKAYRIVPKPLDQGKEGFVSVDGERVPFEPWQAECHAGLGMTLSRSGWKYETNGI